MIIVNLYIIYFILPFVSCTKTDKWLDEKTDRNLLTPTTLEDFEALLNNHSVMNRFTNGLGEIASDGHYITESTWQGSLTDEERNAYTWSHNYAILASKDWTYPYQRIFYANVILEGLQKIKPITKSEQLRWNYLEGNALFQRSRTLYELASIFCPPYNPATASSDLGIPLRIESDVNIPTKRSTVAETYDKLINDLLKAESLLPVTPLHRTHASRPAVYAELARIYLGMREYEKAGMYSDSCLRLYDSLLDYNKLNPSSSVIGIFNKEVIFHSEISNYFIYRKFLIDTSLYNSYDTSDLRRMQFYKVNSDHSVSFKGNYNSSVLLFSGLATDEMYLIRAECYARLGNKEAALNDLNKLLKTRWKKTSAYQDVVALDAKDAVKKVLAERKKELLMRDIRWTDIRRLNQERDNSFIITRNIGGQVYSLKPNGYNSTFPIPDDILQQTGIKQNNGW